MTAEDLLRIEEQEEQIMRSLPDHHRQWDNCVWLQLSRYSVEQMYFMLLCIIPTGVHIRVIVDCRLVYLRYPYDTYDVWVTNTNWMSFISQTVFNFCCCRSWSHVFGKRYFSGFFRDIPCFKQLWIFVLAGAVSRNAYYSSIICMKHR